MLGAEGAVEPVVGAHDAPRVAVLHRVLERNEVELTQRPLVDLRVDRVAFELRVVGDEVLGRGRDPPRLHAPHERRGEVAAEDRVLAVALEVASPFRGAVQVDRGSEEHVGLLGHRLVAEDGAESFDEVGVPGRAERGTGRDAGGPRPRPHQAVAPRPVGAVGDLHLRKAQPLVGPGVPHVEPGHGRDLLVEGHLGQQLLDAFTHGRQPRIPATGSLAVTTGES